MLPMLPNGIRALCATAALLLLLATSAVVAARPPPAERTEVKSLPGWTGQLPSRTWSGYIDSGAPPSGDKMYQHYVFVECENDPATAPVVVWYQGGPGASSMYGLLLENGPLLLNAASVVNNKYYQRTGIPELIYNKWSWTQTANLLIVDNPPPVGYSYCEPVGPSGHGTSCGAWDDAAVARVNRDFLKQWVRVFSDFASLPLYITGESYAGVYVPVIVQALLDDGATTATKSVASGGVNLQGMAVGDGCLGSDVVCGGGASRDIYYDMRFFCGHGQLSNAQCEKWAKACPRLPFAVPVPHDSPECVRVMTDMMSVVAGFDGYNLYDTCWYSGGFGRGKKSGNGHGNGHMSASSTSASTRAQHMNPRTRAQRTWFDKSHPMSPDVAVASLLFSPLASSSGSSSSSPSARSLLVSNAAENDYPCPDGVHAMWLNRTDVKRAWHVPENTYYFSGDNGDGFVYHSSAKNVLPVYSNVLRNTSLRVLVYNADADPAINSFVTQDKYFDYFASLGGNADADTDAAITQSAPWRAWTVDGRKYMGGYVTDYANGQFKFATVRGSGHMVPEFKPAPALAMLDAFVRGKPFPVYDPRKK